MMMAELTKRKRMIKKDSAEDEKKSKLPEPTKKLVQLIFDLNMMNQ